MAEGNIFISYRREDSAGYARSLYDRLNARFPKRVFMDVSRLDPGSDFVEEIERALGNCKALIVLIGKHWAVTHDGTPRLHERDDFVRLEVAHALKRNIRVIPVLVGNAPMPEDLPPDLEALARRHALKLDDASFDFNAGQLIQVLERDLGAPPVQPPRSDVGRTPSAPSSRKWPWVLVGAVGVVGVLVLWIIVALIQMFSEPVDPVAFNNALNAIQQASQAQASPPAGAAGLQPASSTVGEPDLNPAFAPEPMGVAFQPVGRWRISLGDGAAVSLLLELYADGSFLTHSQLGAVSIPASSGRWSYNPAQRMLTTMGVNNLDVPFQAVFANIQSHEGHFHADVPEGRVSLTAE